MNENQIGELKKLLATPQKVVIIPHRNPDGDAMGSTLALAHILNKLGHYTTVIAPNEFPDFLAWLPGAETVRIFEKDRENTTRILNDAEILFTLDFNALHRTGEMEMMLQNLKAPFVMIDHHELPDSYAQIAFSDVNYGSTCEMVYDFCFQLGIEKNLDKTSATCIYTGIVTDSGSFKFPKTTSKTHQTVAHLLELGIENTTIHNQLFNTNSYSSLQLLGKALQNLKVFYEYKTSYITLSQEELDNFNYKKGDTEGIVNYGLSLKDIIFTAIFIENKEEGLIKISLRSIGDFDVNQLARTYFNGGGHKNAAGGKSTQSLSETVAYFEKIIREQPELK